MFRNPSVPFDPSRPFLQEYYEYEECKIPSEEDKYLNKVFIEIVKESKDIIKGLLSS